MLGARLAETPALLRASFNILSKSFVASSESARRASSRRCGFTRSGASFTPPTVATGQLPISQPTEECGIQAVLPSITRRCLANSPRLHDLAPGMGHRDLSFRPCGSVHLRPPQHRTQAIAWSLASRTAVAPGPRLASANVQYCERCQATDMPRTIGREVGRAQSLRGSGCALHGGYGAGQLRAIKRRASDDARQQCPCI